MGYDFFNLLPSRKNESASFVKKESIQIEEKESWGGRAF